MPTLVIKNLPESLHRKLKKRAAQNHRSVTKEVVSLIEANVATPPKFELPAPLKLKSGRLLTLEDIEAAIAEGRE